MCPELESDPEGTVAKVKDHPALYGYFLRDEPANASFPELAKWAEKIRSVDNSHAIYLNLFPNYVDTAVLGSSYHEHVKKFIKEVKLPMVSFDFYPVTKDGVRQSWYNNLEIISSESAAAGLPFWAFALSTAHDPYPVATKESLRFQMYTNLAYGASGLQYFTYWCPKPGAWDFHAAPIDEEGNRTPVYDLVKAMNQELQARAFVFVDSKVLRVEHTGETIPPGVKRFETLPEQVSVLDTKGEGAVVSLLENGKWQYLVLVNRNLDKEFDYDLGFNVKATGIGVDGEPFNVSKATTTYTLGKGDCAIYRWKK